MVKLDNNTAVVLLAVLRYGEYDMGKRGSEFVREWQEYNPPPTSRAPQPVDPDSDAPAAPPQQGNNGLGLHHSPEDFVENFFNQDKEEHEPASLDKIAQNIERQLFRPRNEGRLIDQLTQIVSDPFAGPRVGDRSTLRKLEKALLFGDEVRELMLGLGKALACSTCSRRIEHCDAVVLDIRDGRINLTCMGCQQRPISISCPTRSCGRKVDVAPIRQPCGSTHEPEEGGELAGERVEVTVGSTDTNPMPAGWHTSIPPSLVNPTFITTGTDRMPEPAPLPSFFDEDPEEELDDGSFGPAPGEGDEE